MLLPPAVPPRLAAVAVLTAVGLFASSGRATAGCGDYVVLAADTPAADHAPADPGPPAPCHGPGCSGRPEQPSPPLTAPVTQPADPDPLTASAGRLTASAHPASWAVIADDAGPPEPVCPPVFHPPRAA